jgi:membrane protein DedA with SNARE-associated domain
LPRPLARQSSACHPYEVLLESLIEWLDLLGTSANNLLGLAVLGGSALVEFVFPPFPGDMLTVFGGVLIGAYQWSFALVFAAVTLGSVLGGLLAFLMGRRWQKRRGRHPEKNHSKLTKLVVRFEAHGSVYLLLNRFLPGIRPLFFVAAGLAGMSTGRVLVLSSISAALWNALLLTAGIAVGNNLDRIEHWLKTYSMVVWGLLIVLGLWVAAKALLGRRASRAEAEDSN